LAGFLDALRAFFTPAPAFAPGPDDVPYGRVWMTADADRSLSFSQLFAAGYDPEDANTAAGEQIDAVSAMQSIAFQAGVRLLVNDIGSLPVDAYRSEPNGKRELRKPDIVAAPNPADPNLTWEDHVKQVVYSILTRGESITVCEPNVLRPEAIHAIDIADVVDIRRDGRSRVYEIRGWGTLTPLEVVHIPWMLPPGGLRGLDPISAGREGLGIALASDKFVGRYFGEGAVLSGVIEFPPGVDPSPEQVKAIKADFKRKHGGARKSHAVGALTGGATYKPFDYNNRDAQLLELREMVVEDIARLLGIPPHMLGSQKPGAVGYASVEQRSIDYVTHAVLPIVRRIETGYSRMLRGQQTYLKFNVRGLLRGDEQARAQFYDRLLQNKVMRRDEVRALEDLPFDPESVGYLETPNNNAPDGRTPDQMAAREAAEVIQKIYLGVVNDVLSADKARRIVNRVGADLTGAAPQPSIKQARGA
jgi:HK97 family phage portal protein